MIGGDMAETKNEVITTVKNNVMMEVKSKKLGEQKKERRDYV
jgi:hypothetical protein